MKEDTAWQQLEAIQTGNYFEVPIGLYNWMGFPPSVNRYMGMIWLCNLLYPEQFDYDMYEEKAEFYRCFTTSRWIKIHTRSSPSIRCPCDNI